MRHPSSMASRVQASCGSTVNPYSSFTASTRPANQHWLCFGLPSRPRPWRPSRGGSGCRGRQRQIIQVAPVSRFCVPPGWHAQSPESCALRQSNDMISMSDSLDWGTQSRRRATTIHPSSSGDLLLYARRRRRKSGTARTPSTRSSTATTSPRHVAPSGSSAPATTAVAVSSTATPAIGPKAAMTFCPTLPLLATLATSAPSVSYPARAGTRERASEGSSRLRSERHAHPRSTAASPQARRAGSGGKSAR